MPNCIRINGLEHLPLEETLLIHYTVTCSGLWDLAQNLTAYRNVCDSYWTIMYPNHQHPRHTDFPLLVPPGGMQGIFAWNYGGILGIDPIDFDENHSYLTQLSIYEYSCFYTGVSGSFPTGQTGIPQTGFTGYTGLRSEPALPRPPHIPTPGIPGVPVPGRPPIRIRSGEEPIPTGLSYDPISGSVNPPIPHLKLDPRTGLSGHQDPQYQWQQTSTVGIAVLRGEPGQPNNNTVISNPVLANYLGVNLRGETPTIYPSSGTTPVTSVVNYNLHYNPLGYSEVERPLQSSLSSIRYYENELRSNLIPTVPSVSIRSEIESNTNDIDIGATEGDTAGLPGHLSNIRAIVRPVGIQNTTSIRQIDTRSILAGAFTSLQLGADEVAAGMPIVVSAAFYGPETLSVTGAIYILASSNDVYELVSGSNGSTSQSNPFQLGVNATTYGISPGRAIVVFIVKDNQGTVIGTASKALFIRSPKVIGLTNKADTTPYNNTATSLLKGTREIPSTLFTSYANVYAPYGESKTFIIDRKPGSTDNLSCIFIGSNKEINFSVDIYTTSLYTYDYKTKIDNLVNSDEMATLTGTTILETEARLSHRNFEINPSFPVLGMADIPVNDTINIKIGPIESEDNSHIIGKLYLSDGFSFRPWDSNVVNSGVFVHAPYAEEIMKVYVQGNVSGKIPSSYTMHTSQSNYSGVAFFSGVSPSSEQFYGVVTAGDNTFNPYRYTERVFQAP